jgi:pimeloyl-ACP methyl ester carboxylesterase
LFGQVHGAGAPRIVALHGWGRRGADFDRVLEGVDAVAFDLPGFGATPAPEAPMGTEGYAWVVLAALEEVGPGPFQLLGHSFGGRVAVQIAADHPTLVSSLVLTGVPLVRRQSVSKPSLGYRLIRSAHRWRLVSDQRMESIRRSRGSADYRAVTGVMRDVLVTVVNESYEDQLGRVTCPVDLVWGENDTEVPVGVAERARAILAESGTAVSMSVLPGVGHLTPSEAPDDLRASLGEGRAT